MFSLYFVGRIVSESQFINVGDYGVYDVLSQELNTGSLCFGLFPHGLGTYPEHPAIIYVGTTPICYYGGQTDPLKGDCAAVPTNIGVENRRVCPCSKFGKRACVNDKKFPCVII